MSNLKHGIFTLKREHNQLYITCITDEDSKYALANQQGVILDKGDFSSSHVISLQHLKPGFYSLTLLNAETIEHFSVII